MDLILYNILHNKLVDFYDIKHHHIKKEKKKNEEASSV